MSGRPWIFILIAAAPFLATGCQVDGGTPKMWNPFARSDRDKFADEELPKFVRRIADDKKENSDQTKTPIAESRVESLLAEGQLALQENRIPDARRVYKEVLEFLPDDPTAHHGMAMAADLTEHWNEAESHYRQALRARPRDANLLCDMGYSYLLQNRYSEASSYLTQAIQINPDHENAHTNLALLDVRQGNPEAARTRLQQRYGDTAKVTQILAALQSQTRTSTGATLAASAPAVPENATLEEIREIANRERIAAEQRRAAQNIPVDHSAATNPVSTASHSNAVEPYHGPDLPLASQQPVINQHPTTNLSVVADGIVPSNNNVPAGYLPNTAGQTQPGAVIPYGANSGPGSQPNVYPSSANAMISPMYSNPDAPVAAAWNPNSFTGQNTSANPPSAVNYGASQQPLTQASQAQPTPNTASLSGVISVRPSGTFQAPTRGVSYGQPIGFGQPVAGSAVYPNNGNAAASAGNTAFGNSAYPDSANQNTNGMAIGNMTAPRDPAYGQSHPLLQLEGLNVGPGSLFPVGQGPGSQNGTLKTGNVSAPGSNSVINGAMYGQPTSILPSQEWMMQQQQQIQQLQSQTQLINQNSQVHPDQTHRGPGNDQGYSNSQNFGNNSPHNPYGNTGTAPRPGSQAPPVNPLATYENQLRQLDNQYNNTLQQLDRNAPVTAPRAQY